MLLYMANRNRFLVCVSKKIGLFLRRSKTVRTLSIIQDKRMKIIAKSVFNHKKLEILSKKYFEV